MKKLQSFLKRSWSNRIHFCSTFILLLMIRLGLKVLPFQSLIKIIESISIPQEKANPENIQPIRRVIGAVEASSRNMYREAKCLAKALTTYVLMRRAGYLPDLKIGVAKADSGALKAHAWIEYQGKVAIGNLPDLDSFISLPSIQGLKL
jgi:hypothetical protein